MIDKIFAGLTIIQVAIFWMALLLYIFKENDTFRNPQFFQKIFFFVLASSFVAATFIVFADPSNSIQETFFSKPNDPGSITMELQTILNPSESSQELPVLGFYQLPINPFYLAFGIVWFFGFLYLFKKFIEARIQLNNVKKDSFLAHRIGKVRVYWNSGVFSPFSFWDGKHNIVLPVSITELANWQMTLQHEAIHIKNRDTIIIFLLEIFRCVFWFNPFSHLLIRYIEEIQELIVDQTVLEKRTNTAKQYSKLLYSFLSMEASYSLKLPNGAAAISGSNKFIYRRIEMMFSKSERMTSMGKFLIGLTSSLVLLISTFAVQGAISDTKVDMQRTKNLVSELERELDAIIPVNSTLVYWLNELIQNPNRKARYLLALERMERYEPMILEKLLEGELPAILSVVPIIESGYSNSAVSPIGASGIWQFMAGTARRCGLNVTETVDERFNPQKLTDAAVCYYSKLYAIFNHWPTSIVAYLVGESRMFEVKRQYPKKSIFELAEEGYLGREAKKYLPMMLATMIIYRNPQLIE